MLCAHVRFAKVEADRRKRAALLESEGIMQVIFVRFLCVFSSVLVCCLCLCLFVLMSWYSKVFRGRMINSMQAEINVAEGKKQVNANIFKLGPIILSI